MRFEVPQFIEIEDKIFGPLTWRQFLYLGGGVGMAVVMFLTLPFIIFLILGFPLAVVAFALSFYPVNNRPFSYFLEAVFNYSTKQKVFFWRRKSDVVYKNTDKQAAAADDQLYVTPPEPKRADRTNNIASLARQLELSALQKKE